MNPYDIHLDGIEIGDFGLSLKDAADHPMAAVTRDRLTTVDGRNGVLDFGMDSGPILFGLRLQSVTDDEYELQEILRRFTNFLKDEYGNAREMPLVFGYEPDKFYTVRYQGGIVPTRDVRVIGYFVLNLLCAEGYAKAIVSSQDVTWGNEELTFASTTYTYGHEASSLSQNFTSPGSMNIEVMGHALQPILHVMGSGTNVVIVIGGKQLNLGTFSNTTWLIDFKEKVILKNGVNAIYSGDWMYSYLLPGDNITTVNGTGLNLVVSFDYKDIWNG
ncbi:phage tail domain-containing protein [Chryseomicrobium aureum]|uniref:phage tail domain-containing protein n=1 Tax=Chryseomicrobium aureum TaxID=1441723 RepID=UPI00370D8E5F